MFPAIILSRPAADIAPYLLRREAGRAEALFGPDVKDASGAAPVLSTHQEHQCLQSPETCRVASICALASPTRVAHEYFLDLPRLKQTEKCRQDINRFEFQSSEAPPRAICDFAKEIAAELEAIPDALEPHFLRLAERRDASRTFGLISEVD
ncbi:uncharacterized protein EAE98_010828 [Botrytis deweyae]|uniref:Uncharacterized protein n=1 Tax=Botrytis deweyae TaxID=2478750 RepID=A0ABQ7I7T5_9HELO|nr:uncharacterized protein EAE98_010828 [Botrytis deweyae]KAF7916243.1 hypothetical protein EAE98_010828 [Botrytis deweyae]